MKADATVFIVDDDVAMRDSLALLLRLKGFMTQSFAGAEDFLAAYQVTWSGCILADVRMPVMSGLELQAELAKRDNTVPVIIMTAYGDVSTARIALKAGAADFLEKPIDDAVLIDVLQTAIDGHALQRSKTSIAKSPLRLTAREQQVADLSAAGLTVKRIAEKLGISPRTVEVYRSRMAQKLRGRDDGLQLTPTTTGVGN